MTSKEKQLLHRSSDLLQAARNVAKSAHCPYSGFHVGAAVIGDGQLFTGCNVENASYGLTVCAERVAIFKAISAGAKKISAIAICCPDVLPDSPHENKMPCGACRQVMAEFADEDCEIVIDGVGTFRISQLIPHPFHL